MCASEMGEESSSILERPKAELLCAQPAQAWIAGTIAKWPERSTVMTLTALASAIRLYLMLTNFCIAGDGVAYIRMARLFAAGDWTRGLELVFSPLYPILIALVHHVVPDWELAGGLVSMVFGVATVPAVYYLIREVHSSRDLATGAAALTAIHPELAGYSASVLTEAGFIFLVVVVTHFAVRGIKTHSARWIAVAGLLSGIAYLYRTEAVGLPFIVVGFLLLGPMVWAEWRLSFGLQAAVACTVAFVLVASPYLLYLRIAAGHWMVGRELSAAITYKIGEASSNGAYWRALAFSRYVPLLAPLRQEPVLYLKKAALDFAHSFYYLVQVLEPPFALALLLGLCKRGRAILARWHEALPAAIFCFYFCGLALLYTGRRFLAHYIALTFGWVALGVGIMAAWLGRFEFFGARRLPADVLILGLALATLPRTLWPLGYDLRGYREAGVEIAHASAGARAVVSTDSRVAFYADTEHLELPLLPKLDLCRWLAAHPQAGYVMLTSREEESAHNLAHNQCLVLVRRYPRYGRGYYDLFRVSGPPRGP
jgi:hypothetical protein